MQGHGNDSYAWLILNKLRQVVNILKDNLKQDYNILRSPLLVSFLSQCKFSLVYTSYQCKILFPSILAHILEVRCYQTIPFISFSSPLQRFRHFLFVFV